MSCGRRQTVLFAYSRYSIRGGEDVQTDRAARALIESGWSLDSVVAEPPGSPFEAMAASVSSGALSRSRYWAQRVAEHVASSQPTVAYVQNTFPWMTGSVIDVFAALKIPTIVGLHNFRIACPSGTLVRNGKVCERCAERGRSQSVIHRCYRGSAAASAIAAHSTREFRSVLEKRSGGIVIAAPSHFAVKTLAALAPALGGVEVLPNIVPSDAFRGSYQGVEGQFLLASRLSPEKGLSQVLEGFLRFANGSDARLIVAGDGSLRESLEAEASRLTRSIEFVGQLHESRVLQLMRTSQGILCPSRAPETFGMTVAEAAVLGAPLLVSDAGALAETAGGPDAALVVKDGTSASWTAALRTLVDDPVGTRRRAEVASTHARYCYSPERFAEEFGRLAVLAAERMRV